MSTDAPKTLREQGSALGHEFDSDASLRLGKCSRCGVHLGPFGDSPARCLADVGDYEVLRQVFVRLRSDEGVKEFQAGVEKAFPAIEAANVFYHGDTLVFHPDSTVTKKTPEAKVPEECQCCGGILAEDGTCPQCVSQGCTACVKCGKDADVCECGTKESS